MATKKSKTNGHNPSTERVIAVLERIEGELHAFREETRERIDATNERLDATNQRLDATNDRLLHLDAEMHGLHTDLMNKVAVLHKTRFLRLEAAVFKSAAE